MLDDRLGAGLVQRPVMQRAGFAETHAADAEFGYPDVGVSKRCIFHSTFSLRGSRPDGFDGERAKIALTLCPPLASDAVSGYKQYSPLTGAASMNTRRFGPLFFCMTDD